MLSFFFQRHFRDFEGALIQINRADETERTTM